MLNMANDPRLLLEPKAAEKLAKELNKTDPEWTYRVKHNPTGKGYSFIEIYDEDKEFVDYWKM